MHDSEVVASIAGDRSDGLIEAYDRYADSLYKYCLALLGEPAEAANAVHDTFVIAAARLAGLREPDRLRAWLYAVARHECQRITPAGRPAFAATGVSASAAGGGEDATRAWLRGLLEVAVTGLAPGEREVIELELRHGLAVAEIAAVVGASRTQASALASRARQHLEAGLVAVVVGRAGRRECDWLRMTLADGDGWLTVPLRKQLRQHIGRCAACSTRRDLELHPARLLGQSPGEALAAAAAASFLLAPGPPEGLRAHTLALAASQDPDAIEHRTAVLGRAGAFDSRGFPRQARWDGDGPTHRRGRVAVAAGLVAAAVIGVAAVALIDSSGHGKQAARALAGSPPPPGTAAAVPLPAPPGSTPTGSSTRIAATATATPEASGSATTGPRDAPTATNHAKPPATSPSATADPSATGTPTATAAPGTLAVSPAASGLLVPAGGTTVSLTADGGPVAWSSTVSSGLGTVHLSPSGGTINAGATATVTVTASGLASGRTVTINPGGIAFTIFVGLG